MNFCLEDKSVDRQSGTHCSVRLGRCESLESTGETLEAGVQGPCADLMCSVQMSVRSASVLPPHGGTFGVRTVPPVGVCMRHVD